MTMKIRWLTGDTAGKVEYLDYSAVQQALQSDPEALEILYGLDDPSTPGNETGDAEMTPGRVRHPGAAPDMAEMDTLGRLVQEVPGHGAAGADAGRVGPTVQHRAEALDPGPIDGLVPPGAPQPEKPPHEQSLEHAREVADEQNVKAEETTKQAEETTRRAEEPPRQEDGRRGRHRR
jgi:hypothetical protein